MPAGVFDESAIIPYQFPKSIAIAGNFTAFLPFFCGTFRAPLFATAAIEAFPVLSRMKLTPDELKRIAHLARITVSDAEVSALQSQLSGVFTLIDQLLKVDTTGIAPLAHPLAVIGEMAQRLREDAVTEQDNRVANMQNAPAQENGLFLVPKVLE
jgi:aspartyl-tRNA(Asn)/glutamyl-tRNA(Gln) amidotransferase subunit C